MYHLRISTTCLTLLAALAACAWSGEWPTVMYRLVERTLPATQIETPCEMGRLCVTFMSNQPLVLSRQVPLGYDGSQSKWQKRREELVRYMVSGRFLLKIIVQTSDSTQWADCDGSVDCRYSEDPFLFKQVAGTVPANLIAIGPMVFNQPYRSKIRLFYEVQRASMNLDDLLGLAQALWFRFSKETVQFVFRPDKCAGEDYSFPLWTPLQGPYNSAAECLKSPESNVNIICSPTSGCNII